MIESLLATHERERAAATRRQVLAAGIGVLGLPALAAVALAPARAELKLGFVAFVDAALTATERLAALARAGVAVTPVSLASYGSLADHLAAGAKDGGIDGAIMPAATAERLAGCLAIRVIGSLGGAGELVLLAGNAPAPTNEAAPCRVGASSEACIEAARRRWPSVVTRPLLMPPAQIGPNLQSGAIDLALLPERAAQALADRGIARVAARMFDLSLKTVFALRDEWIAAHPSAALAFRDALVATVPAG